MTRLFTNLPAAAVNLTETLGQFRPLCPELYHVLQNRFGSVKIACPGEAFLIGGWTRDPLTNYLRPALASPGEYYRINCPFCNDTRHRLWVNHMYGQQDPDGRRLTYLATCYHCADFSQHRRNFEDMVLRFRNRDVRGTMIVNPGSTEHAGLFQAPPPGTCIPLLDLPPDHKARWYMEHDRHYTPSLIAKYRLSYCVQPDPRFFTAGDRVIFPIYFDGVYVGWQARYVGDIDWSAYHIPKFYTLPGFHKRLVLYNYDVAKHKPFVVVVEGVSDCHAVGDFGLALLGKSMSQHQRMLLLQLAERTPIVILLDPEARDESQGVIDSIAMAPGQHPVIDVELPGGLDPGKFINDRAGLWNIIASQARARGVPLNFAA
jgi:hypothetical protein